MPKYTIQLAYCVPYLRTEVVEADSDAEACDKAIEAANKSDQWKAADDCGPTFVDLAVRGEHEDPWDAPEDDPVTVPAKFGELAKTWGMAHAHGDALLKALKDIRSLIRGNAERDVLAADIIAENAIRLMDDK